MSHKQIKIFDLKDFRAKFRHRTFYFLKLTTGVSHIYYSSNAGIGINSLKEMISIDKLYITEEQDYLIFMDSQGRIKVVENDHLISRYHHYASEKDLIDMRLRGLEYEEIFAILAL